jgi:type II secretory pathway component GspD/PulD (secretin)
VDITAVADMTLAEATNPISVINDMVTQTITGSATAVQTSFGNSGNIASTGGTQIGFVRDGVAAFIHALDKIVDTTVVANPKLLVLNRQRAEVRDTLAQAVLITKTVDTTTSTSVETVDSGTKLRIRPFISSDSFIRMELKPEISSGQRVDLGETQGIDKDEQSMITNVIVRNGNTVVLGGLIREENSVTRQQTPFLGDVPLLGAAFRDQADSVSRTETIFLVTPTIVRDDSLYAEGEKMQENVRTAQFGARQGLLPFSRTKMVSDHMRNAQTSYKAGDQRRALMNIEMALRLDPNYSQARSLKARILEKLDKPADHFYLDQFSKDIIEKQLETPAKVFDVSKVEEVEEKPMKKTVNQTASVPVE